MSDAVLRFVTDFGDQAVILPVALAVALTLALHRRLRLAATWLVAVAGVLGGTLILKVACYASSVLVHSPLIHRLGLESPSGHVASAAIVYGGLLAIVTPATAGRPRPATSWAFVAPSCIAAIVAVTRVQLGEHSVADVVVGAALGVGGAVAFAVLACPEVDRMEGARLTGVALLLVVLLHGLHFDVEQAIRTLTVATARDWTTK